MEDDGQYLLYGQIQQLKRNYYSSHKEGLHFPDAVQLLIKRGEGKHGNSLKPDFLAWNLTDLEEFRNLINAIPIPVREIREVRSQTEGNICYLPVHNEVQISMESCYCPEELLCVDYFGVVYVMEGGCLLNVKNTVRRMSPGELCILPPNMPFYVRTEPSDIVINILSSAEQFEKNFSSLLYQDNIVSDFFRRALFSHDQEPLFFAVPQSKDLYSIIQHLFAEFVQKDSYSRSLFYNYLQIFYANIIRSVQSTYEYYEKQESASVRNKLPAVLQYISENFRTVTLDELSDRFHYDGTYLGKQLKKSTGLSYNQLLTRRRIAEAKQLLAATDLKIGQIAVKSGYNSTDYFTAAFKKEMGMLPGEYRKQQKKNNLFAGCTPSE